MKETHTSPKKYGPFPLSTYIVAFFILSMAAVAFLAYLNPGEVLRKMRDEKRKEQIQRLSESFSEYYGKDLDTLYPIHTKEKPFITILSEAGITTPSIKKIGAVDYIGCQAKDTAIFEYEGICYSPDDSVSPSLAVIYTRLESQASYALCRKYSDKPIPYFAWSSVQGVSGIVCAGSDLTDPSIDYTFES